MNKNGVKIAYLYIQNERNHIMKKLFVLVGLLLIASSVFSHLYFDSNNVPQVIEFEDSNWNYIVGTGFVDDHAVDVLEQQEFTERSRDYFLGEVS